MCALSLFPGRAEREAWQITRNTLKYFLKSFQAYQPDLTAEIWQAIDAGQTIQEAGELLVAGLQASHQEELDKLTKAMEWSQGQQQEQEQEVRELRAEQKEVEQKYADLEARCQSLQADNSGLRKHLELQNAVLAEQHEKLTSLFQLKS